MRARKVEEKGLTGIGDEADAAAVPVEVSERHRVHPSVFGPLAPRVNGYRPPHWFLNKENLLRRRGVKDLFSGALRVSVAKFSIDQYKK
jgi:hypothetical protein